MNSSIEKDKILFVATVDQKHIIKFHTPFLRWFHEQGYEVHVACAGNAVVPYCDVKHSIPFKRSPFRINNIRAYKLLKHLIDSNGFKLIHCHTPVGGVVGRLAARDARKRGTKVLYTAHGFHFYKGAPIKNWLLYYPVEKWLAKYTDHLITINDEDYQLVIKKKFKAKQVSHVNGVGIDLNRFEQTSEEKRQELRKRYGYDADAFILIYVAEMTFRKHQDLLINAMHKLRLEIPNIRLLLVGDGEKLEEYRNLAKNLRVNDIVEFLGYRNDIPELMSLSNVAVSSSRQEGLPVNIMEAMAIGLPVVASNCRGNRDLLIANAHESIVQNSTNSFVDEIIQVVENPLTTQRQGDVNTIHIQNYSIQSVLASMEAIYNSELKLV